MAVAVLASRGAVAQTNPKRPVRLLVGFTAGGIADVMARIIALQLSARSGQSVIVENHPGAGGNLAMDVVAGAAPDGHTILLISSTNAINETLQKNRKSSLLNDIVPVAGIYRDGAGVMVVSQSSPIQSVSGFIDHAKAHPGEINFASAGIGSTQHLYGEMFRMLTGIRMNHVPYRGAPLAVTDLLAGHVQVMFDTLGNCLPHIRAGKLRALAVTTRSRVAMLPEIPAIAEVVPGYEGSGWQGIGAPKNTPANIVAKLNQDINAALVDIDVAARFSKLGYSPFISEPQEFRQFIANDVARWAKVMEFAEVRAN
jgi:tripartite-type tricarboxylate transporter receptor subunit TctC